MFASRLRRSSRLDPMKYVLLAVASLLAFAVTAHAFEQKDLDSLKAMGNCESCNLMTAYLKQANLAGANLERANLREAELKAADLERR